MGRTQRNPRPSVSRILSIPSAEAEREEAAIYLDPASPRDSSDLPECRDRRFHAAACAARGSCSLRGQHSSRRTAFLRGLAPGGVCQASLLPGCRCALTAPFHPYLSRTAEAGGTGGVFSVALSVALRRPDVIRHPALRSSDFPPLPRQRRPPDEHGSAVCIHS